MAGPPPTMQQVVSRAEVMRVQRGLSRVRDRLSAMS